MSKISNINLTLLENITSPWGIYLAIDSWTANTLSYGILVVLPILAFAIASNRGYEYYSSAAFASLLGIMLSLLFWIGDAINVYATVVYGILFATSLLLLKLNKG